MVPRTRTTGSYLPLLPRPQVWRTTRNAVRQSNIQPSLRKFIAGAEATQGTAKSTTTLRGKEKKNSIADEKIAATQVESTEHEVLPKRAVFWSAFRCVKKGTA